MITKEKEDVENKRRDLEEKMENEEPVEEEDQNQL